MWLKVCATVPRSRRFDPCNHNCSQGATPARDRYTQSPILSDLSATSAKALGDMIIKCMRRTSGDLGQAELGNCSCRFQVTAVM